MKIHLNVALLVFGLCACSDLSRKASELPALEAISMSEAISGKRAVIISFFDDKEFALQHVIEDGDGIMHLAVRSGDFILVKRLIADSVPLNTTNFNSESPLTLAVESGRVRMCQILLEAGADPNFAPGGFSPLHSAVVGDLKESVRIANRFIAKRSRRLNLVYDRMIELLIAAGADVNFRAPYSGSPLDAAKTWLRPSAERILRAHGARMSPDPE